MSSTDADAARYRRAKDIANQALDRPAPQRPAFVADACGDDAALRRETIWLLEAAQDENADTVTLDIDAVAAETGVFDVEAPLPRNYRLLHRLGEGGMGVVYLAERIDGDLRQRVALKLLRLDTGQDPGVARRFAGERRILAALSHRNIARLVDAGITGQGRPFLAMEHVDGDRIDQWCRDRKLPLKARIELFLKVCDAVEYAHRQLVIHRDIKPANILVGADGEPKLLDFGIARLLGVDDGADDTSRTETGLRALTLAYASPEQIEGGPLGTATDIYSLGIVLYQLIAGARPFDHLPTAHLLSNAIVSGEILPPSRVIARQTTAAPAGAEEHANDDAGTSAAAPTRRRWPWPGRGVPRDVDAIVLKSLRREPAQRYTSVAELAADLRRFLGSRPVRARRGHWPYHLRRFAWRWRWAVAAATAFVILLAGFTLERETQLQRTQQERDRAEALAEFMNDLFENADSLRSRGNEATVRELLDRGAQELLARDDLDPPLRRSMLLAMGRAYNALGLGQQALPLLESAYALLPDDGISARERALVLSHLSQAYSSSWRIADSIATDARAIELLTAEGSETDDEVLRLRIRKLHNHTNLLDAPLAQSQAELRAIVDALEARAQPPDTLLMQAYRALTVAYSHPDTADQALTMAERTLEIALRLYRSDDPRLLSTRFVHAMALGQLDPQRAVEPHRSLIADYERVVGPGMSLAAVHSNLGVTLSLLGRPDDSLVEFERAAGIIQQVDGTDNTLYRIATLNIAGYHSDHGDPAEAERLLQERLPNFEAAVETGAGGDRSRHAQALRVLASAKHRLGRLERAEAIYLDASRILTPSDERVHPQVMAGILLGLADVRIDQERLDDAESLLDRHDRLNADRGRREHNADHVISLILRAELLLRRDDDAGSLAAQARALACRTPIQALWWRRLDAVLRQTRQDDDAATITGDCPAHPLT